MKIIVDCLSIFPYKTVIFAWLLAFILRITGFLAEGKNLKKINWWQLIYGTIGYILLYLGIASENGILQKYLDIKISLDIVSLTFLCYFCFSYFRKILDKIIEYIKNKFKLNGYGDNQKVSNIDKN